MFYQSPTTMAYTRTSLVLVVLATLFPQNTAGFYGVVVGWSLQHKRAVEQSSVVAEEHLNAAGCPAAREPHAVPRLVDESCHGRGRVQPAAIRVVHQEVCSVHVRHLAGRLQCIEFLPEIVDLFQHTLDDLRTLLGVDDRMALLWLLLRRELRRRCEERRTEQSGQA